MTSSVTRCVTLVVPLTIGLSVAGLAALIVALLAWYGARFVLKETTTNG